MMIFHSRFQKSPEDGKLPDMTCCSQALVGLQEMSSESIAADDLSFNCVRRPSGDWPAMGLQPTKSCAGWWFGTWILFFHILGIIIPSDFRIFQRSWNHQPVCLTSQIDPKDGDISRMDIHGYPMALSHNWDSHALRSGREHHGPVWCTSCIHISVNNLFGSCPKMGASPFCRWWSETGESKFGIPSDQVPGMCLFFRWQTMGLQNDVQKHNVVSEMFGDMIII